MSAAGRVACLLVPDLPVQAELRARPDLQQRAFVVASGQTGSSEVIAASGEALAAGLRTGMTVAHARSLLAGLQVCVASPALERTARRGLLDAALSIAPRAELAPRAAAPFAAEAAVFADASGMATPFSSERAFASAFAARGEAIGLRGRVGVAGSRFVAQLLARRLATALPLAPAPAAAGATLQVLPPDAEPAFLAALPIDLLAPDDALAQRLTRLGIRRVHELLALPRRSLATRLGPAAVALAARARGEPVEPPLPQPASGRIEEALDLEHPVGQLEPLLFVLRGMLARLAERLAVRGLAARTLDLELSLEDGAREARRSGLAAASCDVRVWLRVLALELESRPPHAAIARLSIAADGEAAGRDQLDLFRPPGPSPAALDRVLAELESLCGGEGVGAPGIADDPRPDAFALTPFAPARKRAPTGAPPSGTATPRPLAVRALRPPVPAQVRVAAGMPVSVRSAVARGHIVRVSGPWRSTGRWWSEQRYALDHFDVQVSDGAVARLCFDWVARAWRIDALYD